jgi:hypothetical protein
MTVTPSNTLEPEHASDSVPPSRAARVRDAVVPKRKHSGSQRIEDAEAPTEDFEHHDTIPAPTWLDDGPEAP